MNKKWPETTYSEQETTWNNLQQPTMSKKRPETTYNNLKRPIMNKKRPGNDLQQARKDLKQPTTSKTQPTVTCVYLQQAKKDAKQPTSRFWDDFTIWDNWFSSLTRFQLSIWLQSFERCFRENHGESRASNIFLYYHVYLLRDTKFTGYLHCEPLCHS